MDVTNSTKATKMLKPGQRLKQKKLKRWESGWQTTFLGFSSFLLPLPETVLRADDTSTQRVRPAHRGATPGAPAPPAAAGPGRAGPHRTWAGPVPASAAATKAAAGAPAAALLSPAAEPPREPEPRWAPAHGGLPRTCPSPRRRRRSASPSCCWPPREGPSPSGGWVLRTYRYPCRCPASRGYFPLPSALGRGLLSAAVFRAAEREAGAGELRVPLEDQLEVKSVTFLVLASTLAAEQAATGDAGLRRGDVPRVGPAASLGLRRAKGGKKRRRGHCEDVALEVTLPPCHGK